MSCNLDYVDLNGQYIDFSQYNILKENLVAGEKICFKMNEKADYRCTNMFWENHLYITGTVFDVYVKPASVVELKIKRKENETLLIDENHDDITYNLLSAEYSNARTEEKISPVFNSLLGQEDYALIENLAEGTKVYGTYIKEQCKDNICNLYALYSFNPYVVSGL